MSDSSLLRSIRSSFATGSTQLSPLASAVTSVVDSSPQSVSSPSVSAFVSPSLSAEPSLDDKLDLLTDIITDVERQRDQLAMVEPTEPTALTTPTEPTEPTALTTPTEPTTQTEPTTPAAPAAPPQSTSDFAILPHADLLAAQQVTDTLNPSRPSGTFKEAVRGTAADAAPAEAATGIQFVEQEKIPELPPEVESFLQRVEEHSEQAPAEIVIADGAATPTATTHHPSQPVIVLPITPEIEHQGKTKSPIWSIRWLVTWSEKIIKMFTGKVIYRQV